MVSTVVDVYNAAISAARGKGRLATISDGGREAEECTIWYDLVRKQVQSAAHWDCCRRTYRLGTKQTRDFTVDWSNTAGDPEPQFTYAFPLPPDYLRAWNMVNYEYFTLSYNQAQAAVMINTNVEKAVLTYSFDNIDPSQWSAGMSSAVIHGLAAFISGPIGGQQNLQRLNIELANSILTSAQAVDANNSTFLPETIPPALVARGYSESQAASRYYYPYGQVFEAAVPNA